MPGLGAALADLVRPSATAHPVGGPVTIVQRPRRKGRGKAGTSILTGLLIDDENNPDLVGAKWYGSPGRLGICQKMMHDPHVARSVDYIADPLCSGLWDFKPASKDPIDREIADFNKWALIERTSWRQTIRRIIRGYAPCGFHFEEPLDDVRKIPVNRFPSHPGEGTGIVPTTYNDLPAWTIDRWFQSKRNARQLAAIQQFVVGSDREAAGFSTVASNRLVRFTYDQTGAQYTGHAVLRAAYQPWKLKMAFLSYDAVKHERTGLGTPSITLGEDAEKKDIDAAESILAEMRVNEKGFLILPSGYKFEWIGASESDSSNLDIAIARCNIDIAYNVAAAFMLLSLMPGSTGSNAVGGTQQGAYHLTIDAHGAFITDAFNVGQDGWSPIERTTRLNYGVDAAVPTLIVRNLPTRDWLKVAASVYKGVAAGVITADDPLEAQLRDSHDLGPHDPETAREKPVSLGSQPKREPGDGEGNESDDPDPFEGDDGGDPTDE